VAKGNSNPRMTAQVRISPFMDALVQHVKYEARKSGKRLTGIEVLDSIGRFYASKHKLVESLPAE
jgi:hypothetical protein